MRKLCQNNASCYEYADPVNQANRNQYWELQGCNQGIVLGKTQKCEAEFCYLLPTYLVVNNYLVGNSIWKFRWDLGLTDFSCGYASKEPRVWTSSLVFLRLACVVHVYVFKEKCSRVWSFLRAYIIQAGMNFWFQMSDMMQIV